MQTVSSKVSAKLQWKSLGTQSLMFNWVVMFCTLKDPTDFHAN